MGSGHPPERSENPPLYQPAICLPIIVFPLRTTKGNCGRCGIFTILGVLHDGTYALCGIGTSVPDLCFGHASKNNVKEIWENAEALNQIGEHLPRDLKNICSKCLLKNIRLGSCVANNYYVEKDLLAGHKFCEDAYKAGAFPMSRYAEPLKV